MNNPFAAHYERCNTGDPADKYRDLPEFPHIIDIEVTSACNYSCLMCPTGNLSLGRKPEFMSWATFETILNQCVHYRTALRFIGWGEPLLGQNRQPPVVLDFIKWAHRAQLLTHLNTNGSLMYRDVAGRLLNEGLDSIKFSFQGTDGTTFEEMRNTKRIGPIHFEKLLETMRMFKEMRGARVLPWIAASTSITYETPEMVAAFKERVEPLVDHLGVGTTIFDYMDMSAVRLRPAERATLERLRAFESTNKRHPVPCPQVYDSLSIHADGSVVVCCNSYDDTGKIGNVNETPIKEIWRHPKIEAYRERLARKDYNAPLCESCFDYMDCVEGKA